MFKIYMFMSVVILGAPLLNAMDQNSKARISMGIELDIVCTNSSFRADLEAIRQLLRKGACDVAGYIALLSRPDFIKMFACYHRFMNITNKIDIERISEAHLNEIRSMQAEYFLRLDDIFKAEQAARSIVMTDNEIARVVGVKPRRPFGDSNSSGLAPRRLLF